VHATAGFESERTGALETNKSDASTGWVGHVREKYFIFERKPAGVPLFFGA